MGVAEVVVHVTMLLVKEINVKGSFRYRVCPFTLFTTVPGVTYTFRSSLVIYTLRYSSLPRVKSTSISLSLIGEFHSRLSPPRFECNLVCFLIGSHPRFSPMRLRSRVLGRVRIIERALPRGLRPVLGSRLTIAEAIGSPTSWKQVFCRCSHAEVKSELVFPTTARDSGGFSFVVRSKVGRTTFNVWDESMKPRGAEQQGKRSTAWDN
jgi:hypothetical protein